MEIVITNPYVSKDNVYQGQLHCHSACSHDGVDTPAVLITAYKNAGYDFIALTDHNVLTPDPGVSGILFISGVEETANTLHDFTNIGAASRVGFLSDQAVIDGILNQGAIPIIAHPTTGTWSDAQLLAVENYVAIEIHNDTTGNQEDRWDTILSNKVRASGVAVDDCHDIAGPNFDEKHSLICLSFILSTP